MAIFGENIAKPARVKRYALYKYTLGEGRSLAKGCKVGSDYSVRRSAKMMGMIIPRGATIIPIPNSSGVAETTLELCRLIAETNPSKGYVVLDALVGNRRDKKLYELKIEGKSLNGVDFGYRVKEGVVIPANAWLIDNVYDTGTTYRAASAACGVLNIAVISTVNEKDVKVCYGFSGRAALC